jgi:hypothetical protein
MAWPTRGPDFNRWFKNVSLFAEIVQENSGLWLIDSDLKYLNVRIDTRSGAFKLTCRDGEEIDVDRVLEAATKARARGLNRVYDDLTGTDEQSPPASKEG